MMNKNISFIIALLSIVFLSGYVSAVIETTSNFGALGTCFGSCSSYDDVFYINDSIFINDFFGGGGINNPNRNINNFIEGYITLIGASNNDSASVISNLTYLSNITSGIVQNFTFNNTNNFSISSFEFKGSHPSANGFNIYVWNWSSNSFKLIDACSDFCFSWTTYMGYENSFSWSNHYQNMSSGMIIFQLENTVNHTSFYVPVLHGIPTPRYAQNLTLSFIDDGNYRFQFWNNSNFTNLNSTTLNITNYLKSIYPTGLSSTSEIELNISGQGYGGVSISGNITYDYTPVTGGGGSITPTEPVRGNDNGAGTVIIDRGGSSSWSMEFGENIKRFDAEMTQGQNRTFSIQFENLGTENRVITLTCDYDSSDVCNYVSLNDETFTLQLLKDTKQIQEFSINLPEEFLDGNYSFNIIAKDDLGRRGALTVFLTVGILGLITSFFLKLFAFSNSGIPYSLVFFPVAIFSAVLLTKILGKNPLKPLWVIIISLVLGIISISFF